VLRRTEPLEPVVLALPRGGVPVAFEVSQELRAPLDVLVVRKLGLPHQSEVAMGAIASGGAVVLNHEVITRFDVSADELEAEATRQAREVTRRVAVYRSGVPALDVSGRNVILVDDGMATGASMQVAVQALRQYRPDRVIVAVPVAAAEGCELVSRVASEVICAEKPGNFEAVGAWYEDFEQTSDAEVVALLAAARRWATAKQRAS